jgi:NTP pyrophosphatase (non-canonical NTP hydrolase)
MTFAELQARVDAWIGQFQEGYWPPLANLARLVEEVGELSRELNHRFGPKKKKGGEGDGDLALELADIVFVLAAIANSLGVDLEDAMRRTMDKYAARDATRWLRKDGEAGAMRVERVRFPSTGGYDLVGLWTDPPRGDGSARAARAAIVCAHGMLSSKESDKFQVLAERMWREGVACLRFDMSGRGESGGDPSRILYSQETLDVASAVAFARARGRSEVALCGSSMGGAVSVLYAALDASARWRRSPRFRGPDTLRGRCPSPNERGRSRAVTSNTTAFGSTRTTSRTQTRRTCSRRRRDSPPRGARCSSCTATPTRSCPSRTGAFSPERVAGGSSPSKARITASRAKPTSNGSWGKSSISSCRRG